MKCIALHGYVSGRVQGVSYRAFVAAQAREHDLSGWARNLADGRVEVLLCGAEGDVNAVAAALRRGPPLARVTNVALHATAMPAATGFTIG